MNPQEIARWFFRAAQQHAPVERVRTSPVWPPYEDEAGFILTIWPDEEFEVLVRKRDKDAS